MGHVEDEMSATAAKLLILDTREVSENLDKINSGNVKKKKSRHKTHRGKKRYKMLSQVVCFPPFSQSTKRPCTVAQPSV